MNKIAKLFMPLLMLGTLASCSKTPSLIDTNVKYVKPVVREALVERGTELYKETKIEDGAYILYLTDVEVASDSYKKQTESNTLFTYKVTFQYKLTYKDETGKHKKTQKTDKEEKLFKITIEDKVASDFSWIE